MVHAAFYQHQSLPLVRPLSLDLHGEAQGSNPSIVVAAVCLVGVICYSQA